MLPPESYPRALLTGYACICTRLRSSNIQSQTEGFEDPSLLLGSDADKELGRAKRVMGPVWVDKVRSTADLASTSTHSRPFVFFRSRNGRCYSGVSLNANIDDGLYI